jgi:hypothetical protein
MANQQRLPHHTAPSPDPRATRVAAKKLRLDAVRESHTIPRVRVLPATEVIRRTIKHPRGMRFRTTGSVEWPNDSFTQRRLADGTVTIEQPNETPVTEEA